MNNGLYTVGPDLYAYASGKYCSSVEYDTVEVFAAGCRFSLLKM